MIGKYIKCREKRKNEKREKKCCKPWECTHTHTHTSSLLKKEKGAIIPYVLVVCLFILTIRNSRIYKHKQ